MYKMAEFCNVFKNVLMTDLLLGDMKETKSCDSKVSEYICFTFSFDILPALIVQTPKIIDGSQF